jgi:hypothetical protein
MNDEIEYNTASVETIVHRTLLDLRRAAEGIDGVFAGPWTERLLRQIFDQATDEILEIINGIPQGGSIAGQQLIASMAHHDSGVRALAASFCGLKGVPSNLVMETLQQIFLHDNTLVVKMAAAVQIQALAASTYQLPQGVESTAQQFVEAYLELARQQPGSAYFDLHSVKNSSLTRDELQGYDPRNAVARAMMNMMPMLQLIPRLIALQSTD